MTLSAGTRFGPYEIGPLLGVGGMGEVYRARDTRLQRDVALKILPEAFASDAERLARFKREAQVLASLNHPNIATIHGLEEATGVQALVLELVEGETLADRIARGAIPLDEALPIARQIAEALEAAHDRGIIHRDLKPANIKLRPDGAVKVLDFGLAKLAQGPGPGPQASVGAFTDSPTITTPAMTQLGVIMGTAAYMSPEQAKGRDADRRSDIWAFGCVLYEMLTGQRAFPGDDVSDTLASVLKSNPEWATLPPSTSPSIRRLLSRCLEKDRRRRLADIADARFDLDDAADARSDAAAPEKSRSYRRVAVKAFVAGLLVCGVVGAIAAVSLRSRPVEASTLRFDVSLPNGWTLATGTRNRGVATAPLAVSPDGRHLAILARNADGRDRLWVRSLDTLAARELAGTDGAIGPFWSPDGLWLGFFADGKLKKIALAGGPAITICDTPRFNSASWGPDGTIVFALGIGSPTAEPIKRVPAAGGVATDATVVVKGDGQHLRPIVFPDGRHFLFRVNSGPTAGFWVSALDSTDRTRVLDDRSGNVAFADGRLLFLRDATLMAQLLDQKRLTLAGEPVPIAEQVSRAGASGVGSFSASSTVLAYYSGRDDGHSRLTWVGRDGTLDKMVGEASNYRDLVLAPDGRKALVIVVTSPGVPGDLWLVDTTNGTTSRFTFDSADNQVAWYPDGSRVIYAASRKGPWRDLYRKNADLSGTEQALLRDESNKNALSVSPDGQFLLYESRGDLKLLPLSGEGRPRSFLEGPSTEREGTFSPDGHWFAYTSNQSGVDEVYVAQFPGLGGRRQVSRGGGSEPVWRRDGTELFYLDANERLMVAATSIHGDNVDIGAPRPLFVMRRGGGGRTYAVSPDGQRVLVNMPEDQPSSTSPITVVVNWH